ncbi:aminotransferase class V-fold PLP-dependent enzyme [Ruegeria sp. 2012CJ41-6]|uniref:Aminotransferase class V-fold PLP-dependent enzyme n=1 Tax=Ruegeria spongiae TaxID=2942209 RepID=A0ABT0Q7I6_9RHOB|nr:aminotransferase class V-fold PLP-dependent enzyme [Ruegeria spongiae]MCL6285836.1 aminotransferase class V-fold PLP-dependent enzyme [Ruegeria spongiae]
MNAKTPFPKQGRPWSEVKSDIATLRDDGIALSTRNQLMNGINLGEGKLHNIVQEAYNMYFHGNGVSAGMDPLFAQMQSDLLAWAVDLLNGGTEGLGHFTGGGSESIFLAIHAAREWARDNLPNAKEPYEIVMPRTGHAAFDKAAHYQGLKIVRIPAREDFRADVDAMNDAVTANTIMIVGSAPNWGFGRIDPIGDLASVAERHGLWMHVDCCVGGYLLPFLERLGEDIPPFDFRHEAVCSISADLHKHAYAAKPASTVMYRSKDYQKYHHVGVKISDWQCPPYVTEGTSGSRPAAAVVAAWAAFSVMGEDGYVDLNRRCLEVKKRLVDGIEAIEDFKVLPNQSLLVPFRSETLNMLNIYGGLVERGYFPWGTFDPMYVHPSAEMVDPEIVDRFLEELAEIGKGVREGTITAAALAAYAADL